MKPSLTKNGASHRVFERPNPVHLIKPPFDMMTQAGRERVRLLVEAGKKSGLIKVKPPENNPATNYLDGRPRVHEFTVRHRDDPAAYQREWRKQAKERQHQPVSRDERAVKNLQR